MQIEDGVNDQNVTGDTDVAAFGRGYVTIAAVRALGPGTTADFKALSERLTKAFPARK
jgi:hypothetical protein